MELKINWWHKRTKHASERAWEKGISPFDIKEALNKGQKIKQGGKIFESIFRYFSVVYEEKIFKKNNIRKVYPITIKVIK